ncbi:MAG: hypothetical protein Q9227_007173 [Pyrenula ochraceoflavens]
MLLLPLPQSLVALILTISATIHPSTSISFPQLIEDHLPDLSLNQLLPRGSCATPCGYYGQVCCPQGQACYTDSANQAQCSAAPQTTARAQSSSGGGGQYQMFTTTYVETDLQTVTSTYSSLVTSAAGPGCKYSLGETACGNTCCSSGQFCLAPNQCAAAGGGGSSGYYSSFYTVTTATAGGGGSAPLRPTSGTIVTITSTGSATTTVPYVTPVGTDGSSLIGAQASSSGGGGLSGGAIAGIVIGVLVGLFLLFLLCACLCFRGLIDGLLGILGLRDRRRRTRETTYIEERRSSHHHGSAARVGSDRNRGRTGMRTWFGTRPSRVTERREERKTGGGMGGLAGVGAGLGTLALLLGLKRNRDQKRRQDEMSEASGYGSYYTDEYTTSASKYL